MAMSIPIVMTDARAHYETPVNGIAPFDDVPTEIIVAICKFAPVNVRTNMRLVAKQWRRALCSNDFIDVPIKGSAVFFLPNVQLTSLDGSAFAGHQVSMDLPRWIDTTASTESGHMRSVPWSLASHLGIEQTSNSTDDIDDETQTVVSKDTTNMALNTRKFQAYLEKNCRRSLRPTKATALAASRETTTPLQSIYGYKSMLLYNDDLFAKYAERFGCSDDDKDAYNDAYNDNVKMDDDIESAADEKDVVRAKPVCEPWEQHSSIQSLLCKRHLGYKWVHYKQDNEYKHFNREHVWRLDNDPFSVAVLTSHAPTAYRFSDPYVTSLLFGDRVLHPGRLTLVNGRCNSSANEYGVWICVDNIVLNTLLLNAFLDNGSNAADAKSILRLALGYILSIEHKRMERAHFSFDAPRASLQNAKTAPAIDAIPWRPELALYDFQKETVRSMAQLEAQIAARHPIELRATNVLACSHTMGMLYVDKTTNEVLSAAEGYALKTGAGNPVRTDNVLFYTAGGVLMDDVGMGKTRQVVALAAHFPVTRPSSAGTGLCLVKHVRDTAMHYDTEWHTDMARAERANVLLDWRIKKLKMSYQPYEAQRYRIEEYVASTATLVLCGNHLIDQWCAEATRAFPGPQKEKNTRVLVIGSKRDHEAVTLAMLAAADMVIVTIQFLCGTYYRNVDYPERFENAIDYYCLHPDSVKPEALGIRLDSIEWARLVVDEVSTLKWSTSKSTVARRDVNADIKCLKSVTRWLPTASIDFDLMPGHSAEPSVPEFDDRGRHVFSTAAAYFHQTGFEHMVLEQFLEWHFRIPMVGPDSPDPLFWLPHSGNAYVPRVGSIMHEALCKSILRQTKKSTIREHYVSKPLNHGISYALSDYEKRFMDIVTAIPIALLDDTLYMAESRDHSIEHLGKRVLHKVYQGKRQVFADMADANPRSLKPLNVDSRAGLVTAVRTTLRDLQVPFLTNMLLEPDESLDSDTFFTLATHAEDSSTRKLDTHKARMKELHLHCVPGHTLADVMLAWIQFYTRLVAATDHVIDRCWEEVGKLRDPFTRRNVVPMLTHTYYNVFECAVGKKLCEFMFNVRLKTHLERLWIAPLRTLLDEYKAERAILTTRALRPPVHALRRLTIGARLDAILTTMEHLWAREASLVMIVASAHYDLLLWLAHYLDERDIEYANFNRANYHGKRKALARIREQGTAVRVILYHFGGKSSAHEGSNLPEVSNILFLDAKCGSAPDEFDAARTQTEGRAYRHGQRYQINVIDFYEPKHAPAQRKSNPLIPVDRLTHAEAQ